MDPGLVSPEPLALTRSLGDPARDLVILAEGIAARRRDLGTTGGTGGGAGLSP